MAAGFQLTLDTAAPRITWGPVDGAVAGEELRAAYLTDEPGVEHAELELTDGRVLAMADDGATLSVQLPADAPEGLATIRAYLVDEVGNAAVATQQVAVSGVLAPPVERPPSTLPRREWLPRLIETARSIARARDRLTVTALDATRDDLPVRSRYLTPGRQRVVSVAVGTASSRTALSGGAVVSSSRADGATRWTVTGRRPEGPRAEDELLLLDLL